MKGHVMLQFQNSFGTPLTDSLEAVAVTESSLMKGIEQIIEEGNYGRFAESPYHEGKHSFEGDITLEANPQVLGWFLKSVVGWTSQTCAAASQTYEFKPRTSDFDELAATDPLTIEMHFDVGSAAVFQHMCGNTLNFNITNGELLDVTAGFIGAGFTRKSAGSPTYEEAAPFKWDQMSASFNGAAVVDIQDMTISINNNLEPRYTLQNTYVPRKIKRSSKQVIEVTGTMIFQSHSYWQAFEAQTEYPFEVMFTSNESPHTIKFEFPALRFKNYEPSLAGEGLIEASFTAGAMYHSGSGTAMEITLVNTHLGYPVIVGSLS